MAELKRRKTSCNCGCEDEAVAKTTVKAPDVSQAIKTAKKTLKKSQTKDAERLTAATKAVRTRLIKVCSVCGEEDCNVPNEPTFEARWIEKRIVDV